MMTSMGSFLEVDKRSISILKKSLRDSGRRCSGTTLGIFEDEK